MLIIKRDGREGAREFTVEEVRRRLTLEEMAALVANQATNDIGSFFQLEKQYQSFGFNTKLYRPMKAGVADRLILRTLAREYCEELSPQERIFGHVHQAAYRMLFEFFFTQYR